MRSPLNLTLSAAALMASIPLTLPGAALAVDEPPLAQCGQEPYRLLPESQMGILLDWEEVDYGRFPPGLIDALLGGTDLASITPVPYGAQVYRYRYTTQDRGVAVEATAMLAVPTHANPSARSKSRREELGWALYLHGTTGFSDPCAPSALPEGPALAALVASQGFVVVAPDYIGMNGFGAASTTTHGYDIGEQTAIGSWDALRAAQDLLGEAVRRLPYDVSDDVVIWGSSQGGHAALFTELYGPYYAPEFQVAGVVASIPPTDLKPLVKYGFQSLSGVTTLMASEMVANQAWYGSPDSLDGIFTNVAPYFMADNAYDYVFPQEECNPGDGLDGDSVDDLFEQEFIDRVLAEDWDALQPFTCFWEANSLRTSPVRPLRFTPTLMQYSEEDELVIMDLERPDFSRLCSEGYRLQYLECAGASHTDGALWSITNQVNFAKDRLAGKPMNPADVCVVHEPVCCPGSPADVCTP